MSSKPKYWNKAIKSLSKKDKVIKELIIKYNDKFLTTRKDIFYSLCKSIIGQQISDAAAVQYLVSLKKKQKKLIPLLSQNYLYHKLNHVD